MTSTITLGGNSVPLVALPSSPGPRSVDFTFSDSVAVVRSPFTGQTQVQQWPGADMLIATVTLPRLTQTQADAWISFLMELRGMANAFQIGDPLKSAPTGVATGTPVVGTTYMTTMGTVLYSSGWSASTTGLLLPGDYVQVGYRLYRVLDKVTSDSSGNAPITIWPSLREVPTSGTAIIVNNPVGLWRLSDNKRMWSFDETRLTSISFHIMEYR